MKNTNDIKQEEKVDFAKFIISGETIDGNIAIENLYIRLDVPGSVVSKFAYKELLCENFGEYDTVSVKIGDICGVCGVPYCKSNHNNEEQETPKCWQSKMCSQSGCQNLISNSKAFCYECLEDKENR
jgi:hypothetical protein